MNPTKNRILCIDDHTDTCDLITHILTDYEVISAHSMADAIKRATDQKFDLYLLDYHLPDGTVLELCIMLRGFDRDTPMLFATATGSLSERQVINAGAQGLMKKVQTCRMSYPGEWLRSSVCQLHNSHHSY
jgi:CheY-like chemotaxis protein